MRASHEARPKSFCPRIGFKNIHICLYYDNVPPTFLSFIGRFSKATKCQFKVISDHPTRRASQPMTNAFAYCFKPTCLLTHLCVYYKTPRFLWVHIEWRISIIKYRRLRSEKYCWLGMENPSTMAFIEGAAWPLNNKFHRGSIWMYVGKNIFKYCEAVLGLQLRFAVLCIYLIETYEDQDCASRSPLLLL